jgi:hypothetical protein
MWTEGGSPRSNLRLSMRDMYAEAIDIYSLADQCSAFRVSPYCLFQ